MGFSARATTKGAARIWRRRSCTSPRSSSTLQIGKMTLSTSDFRLRTGQLAIAFVVFGNIAFSTTSASFTAIDPALSADAVLRSDPAIYVSTYYGRPVPDSWAKYRVIIPFLARLVPDVPSNLLYGPDRPFSDDSLVIMKFAVVNLSCLVATAVVLWCFTSNMGFAFWQSLLAGMLFLSTNLVVKLAAYPLSDAGYWLCLALAAIAIQKQHVWALAAVMLIGVFVNEQLFLVVVLVALSPFSRSSRMRMLLAVLPAAVAYSLARLRLGPLVSDYHASGMFVGHLAEAVRGELTPQNLIRLVLSFGLLWIPGVYAAVRCSLPPLMRKWVWFLPIEYASSIVLGAGSPVGSPRFLVATYFVVVPLAVIGMSSWGGWRPDVRTENSQPQ